MILSKIKLSSVKKPLITQRIKLQCDNCNNIWNSALGNQINGIKKYNKDLCRGCKQIEQNKKGLRKQQYINAGIGSIKSLKGKSYEEIFGVKKSNEIKNKISKKLKGDKNPNFGGKYSKGFGEDYLKIIMKQPWEKRYGKEKSDKMKQNMSKNNSGKNNPMFGKPSPQGSGNGWAGWYKGWFFRSLMELSFMINVIERYKFNWKSGETKTFKIPYKDKDNINRNYFPDFILNEKYIIEIKPKPLHNSNLVKLKKDAALLFCKKHNYIYKIIESPKILFNKIKTLKTNGDIIFTKRYEEKFKNLKL